MSEIVVIDDNNNFAPSLFWSLCEIIGDCFDAPIFSLRAHLGSKNIHPRISYNDLKRDGGPLLSHW